MKDEFVHLINSQAPFDAVKDFLRTLKDSGYKSDQVYKILEEVRCEMRNDENMVLEIMDVVAGFCSPHQIVWN